VSYIELQVFSAVAERKKGKYKELFLKITVRMNSGSLAPFF